jgi:accessory gene regulator protein AgrB
MRRSNLYRFFNNALHCTFFQRLFMFMIPTVCFEVEVPAAIRNIHGLHSPTLFTPTDTPPLPLAERKWKRKKRN